MYVKKLTLKDFRNWQGSTIELSDGVNVFEGRNAQGKTNLLEALYVTCVGKSQRTPRDKELIRWDCDRAYVAAQVQKKYGSDNVEIVLSRNVNKCVSVNSLPLTKLGELMGTVLGVLFSPEEIKTVKESPSERRRFVDVALSQMSKSYFYALNRYNKILAQRNRRLKQSKIDPSAIDVWDMQLAAAGAGIVKSRRGFLQRLLPHAKDVHSFITEEKEELSLAYEGASGESVKEIEENMTELLLKSRESDLRLGFTHIGPHKDDVKITADGMDIRSFGSQGQQRTAALSLQLALLRLMTEFTGESPVLLLDDVMSELDCVRRERLLRLIRPYQVIITCTELPELIDDKTVKRFVVDGGKIV